MYRPKLHPVLGVGATLALVASCQAVAPTGGAGEVATAGAPAGAPAPGFETPAAIRRMLGYPARPDRPALTGDGRAPGFSLKADNLFGVEVAASTATGDQEFVSLVYDATNKNHIAVWQDGRNGASNTDIYAQVMSSIGLTSGSVIAVSAVSTGMELGPRVAFNSTAGEFMVAWTDTRNGNADVYTQRLTSAGAVTGSALQVASGTGNQILLGLAYHATQNQYLVAWTDDAGGASATVKAGRITAANAKTGTDLTVNATAGALGNGAVAVQGTTDYAVVWANGTSPGVYAQRVTSAGALNGSTLTIQATSGYEYYHPRIAYNPVVAGWMVAFERRLAATQAADVFHQRVTTAWALNGSAIAATSSAGDQMFPALGCNTSDGNYFLAWGDTRGSASDMDVYAKMIKPADGTDFLAEYAAGTGSSSLQIYPAISFDSTRKHFMVGYQDSRAYATTGWDMYTQRVVAAAQTALDTLDETTELVTYYSNGVTSGGVNGALSQLSNAISKITADQDSNAINHLNNFISQINGISDTIIDPSEKAALVALAQEAINQINANNTGH